MKTLKNYLLLCALVLSAGLFAQQSQGTFINYQGVAYGSDDDVLINEVVDLRIALRFGAPNAIIDYTEDHTVTTNAAGVFNLQIGTGTVVSGNFNTLDWGNLAPFASVMVNGTTAGTVRLHSVPYANASGKAKNMEINDLTNVDGIPTNGQVLKFNGTGWEPANDNGGGGGSYTAGDGIDISGTNEISALLGTEIETTELVNNAVTTVKIDDNAVTGTKIAPMGANNGQVLKYDGTDWTPANDNGGSGGSYTAGDGIDISGSNEITATLGTSISTAEIDADAVTNAKIIDDAVSTTKIQDNSVTGEKIAAMAAANGQVLKYDGLNWAPANDNTGGGGSVYTAGDGISISGTDEISADLGTDIDTSELQINAVNTVNVQDDAITASKLDQMGATNGQIIKWNGTDWAPSNDNNGGGGGPVYTAGDGIVIDGADQITAVLGTDIENSELQNDAVSTVKIQDNAITGDKISTMAASSGQVLKYDGTTWVPSNDNTGGGGGGPVYTAGDGIVISGADVITATLGSDIETNEIQNNAITAPKVADNAIITTKIQDEAVTGDKIATMTATNGQVLKFDGSTWTPANDNTGGGGGPIYTAGDGIVIDGADQITAVLGTDIENSELQNDAVSTVKIQNNAVTGAKIAPMAAANGQVLKYDGTDWVPANDDGQVYTAGDGIILAGTDIQATLGTSIETVEIDDNAVTGAKIAPMAAANGQVLKYDGTDWVPANDDGQVYTAGDGIIIAGNDIQTTLGTSIETAEIDDNAVTGAKIAPMAAGTGQVLTYDGTDWAPASATAATSIDGLSDGKADTDGSSLFLGTDAGANDDGTDNRNVGVGYQALTSNTTGIQNTATGNRVLISNTTGNRNTANGYLALSLNTTGAGNTANGSQSLQKNTTGDNNTANGFQALNDNTTGNQNTANGYLSLSSNTTGDFNTAYGTEALRNNTIGSNTVAIGYQALRNNTGDNNVATGSEALRNNTTGDNNTANGSEALYSNTTGNWNTAIGREALYSNTTGFSNTANGYKTLYSNTTGLFNTANGVQALSSNTTGDRNTANGTAALNNNTTGFANTAYGHHALNLNTTGDSNTANGRSALYRNITGSGNIALGYNAGYNETGSNKLYIANSDTTTPLIYGEFDIERLTLNGETIINSLFTGLRVNPGPAGDGIQINNAGDNGVEVNSADNYGGFFKGVTTGVYAESSIDANPDLILGGSISNSDGIISSDPAFPNSGIRINSNGGMSIHLDQDQNNTGTSFNIFDTNSLFTVQGGGQAIIGADGSGRLVIDGTNDASLDPGSGTLIIGDFFGNNLIMDGNEIMARNNYASSVLRLQQDGGAVSVGGSVVHASDRRLKKDIEALPYGLEEILQLQPKAYNWKNRETDHKSLGLIAQDVQLLIKEVVTTQDDAEKTLGISYTELIPVLINAIQEQQDIMANRTSRIEQLEASLTEKETALHTMNTQIETITSRLETLELNKSN